LSSAQAVFTEFEQDSIAAQDSSLIGQLNAKLWGWLILTIGMVVIAKTIPKWL